jgi:signal transduction histidine kinase
MSDQDRLHIDVDKVKSIIHHHLNSTRIFNTTFDHIVRFLHPDPFEKYSSVTVEALLEVFAGPLQDLDGWLRRIAAAAADQQFSPEVHDALKRIATAQDALSRARADLDPNALHTFGEAGAIIADALDTLRNLDAPIKNKKDLVKETRKHTDAVLRICCLYDVRIAKQMTDASNDSLRIVLRHLNGERLDAFTEIHDLGIVVSNLVEEWRGIAAQQGIELRFKNHAFQTRVAAPLYELQTMVKNLLDNAIKYTGKLHHTSKHPRLWVTITLRALSSNVTLDVESWGTPITEEELRTDALFEPGKRGYYADLSGIAGSGMGLTDVRKLATRNKGHVQINTTRALRTGETATRPETTTITLVLPLQP